MAEIFRYAAFISYSSKDAAFAKRLHRALESYGIPSQLGNFDLIGGGKKNRVYPVFRDREELSAGDLGDRIEASLRASAALIVVCSPNAAASPWVQKEIEFFAANNRRDKIFAIIADNAPSVDKAGNDATPLSFPPAFLGDALTDKDALEPLAADARRRKDGFRNAWLKIVAGLIGVSPGQIVDRDRRRRRLRRIQIGAVIGAVILLISVTGSQNAARTWRSAMVTHAESLTASGYPLDALPFAISGVASEGALTAAQPNGADALLGRLGGARLAIDLGALLSIGPAFALSDNGAFLVTQGADWNGKIYALRDGLRKTDLGDIKHFAISADGATLVTTDYRDEQASVYALAKGGSKTQFGPLGSPQHFALSADGTFLVTQSRDGRGAFYALNEGGKKTDLGALGPLSNFTLSADSRFLFVQEKGGNGALYSLTKGGRKTDLGPLGELSYFYLSYDGAFLQTRRKDGARTLYALKEGAGKIDFGAASGLKSFALSSDGGFLFTQSADGKGALLDVKTGRTTDLGNLGEIGSSMITDHALVLQRRRGSSSLISLEKGGAKTDLGDLSGPRDIVLDGRSFFTRLKRDDGVTVKQQVLYTIEQGGRKIRMRDITDLGDLGSMRISADGNALITDLDDGTLFQLEGNVRQTRIGTPRSSAASADGAFLVVHDSHDRGALYALHDAPWPGEQPRGAQLVQAVCRANGDTLSPFPDPRPLLINEAYSQMAGKDANVGLYLALYGRPRNPCDWRGLGALWKNPKTGDAWFEGPRQWLRREALKWGIRPDYKCGEGTYGASKETLDRRRQSCPQSP